MNRDFYNDSMLSKYIHIKLLQARIHSKGSGKSFLLLRLLTCAAYINVGGMSPEMRLHIRRVSCCIREFCETVTTDCVRFVYDTNSIPVLRLKCVRGICNVSTM